MSSGLYQIRDKNLDTTLDLTRLKPYGDTMNDGKVQTSFTLPVKDDDKGAAAAVMLAQKMGLADPNVALRQKLDENFTFYVVYGSLTHSINYNEIVVYCKIRDDARQCNQAPCGGGSAYETAGRGRRWAAHQPGGIQRPVRGFYHQRDCLQLCERGNA